MKYTIQVNQAGADAAGLRGKVDIIDLAIFDAFKDFANGTKCEKKVGPDGRVWFWISYSLIIAEIPYCGIKTNDGIYRRMKNLQAAGVIDFHPDNQRENKTFFTWGASYDYLISTIRPDQKPEVVSDNLRMKNRRGTDEKPEGYGSKTGGGTDQKPDDHYTNTNFTNPLTKNNNAGASDPLTPPFQKIGEIDPETFGLEEKENHSPHRGPALRVSLTDPELPVVTVVEEIAPGPKTKPVKTGRTQQAEQEIETAARVIAHLNEKTGRKFRVNVGANGKGIIARMREGFTESQMQTVIDYKCRTWLHDAKMSEYLNPETLFRPSNFENYLQAATSITVQAPKAQQPGRQSINYFGGGEYPVDEVQKF